MKRVTKLLLLLLVATLMIASVGIYVASASQDSTLSQKAPDGNGYAYKIFKPSSANGTTGTTTYYLNTKDNLIALHTHLNDATVSGSVITLLCDVTVTYDNCRKNNGEWYKDAAWTVNGKKYLDLNGYSLTFVASQKDTASTCYGIELAANATLYLYSSDTAYKSQIRTYVNGLKYTEGSTEYKNKTAPLFNMRYNSSTLYFGTVENAPKIAANGKSISLTSAVSGDHIVTYTGALFTSHKARYKANPTGANAYIRGGTHYHTHAGTSLITSETGVNVFLEDATFISTVAGGLISTNVDMNTYTQDGETNYIAPADGNITADNCYFYSNGAIMQEAYESTVATSLYAGGTKVSSIVFSNCYFSGTVLKSSANNGMPDFNNCYFANAATTPGSSNKTVAADKTLSFDVPTVTYSYGDDLTTSISISTPQTVSVNFRTKTATEGQYATITWKGYGEVKETYWDLDGDVIPSPEFTEMTSGLYKYAYSTPISPITGDATYELLPTISFSFKSNLTLYAHFVYNVYIPKDVVDDDAFISVSLAGKAAKLDTVVSIEGEKYYIISYEVPAKSADQSFEIAMTIEGYNEVFVYTKDLSVPDYVNAVNGGGYSAEAKALVTSAYTYIKAARNYFSDGYLYSIPELPKITGSAAKPLPDSISGTVYGMTLELAGMVKYRIFIYNNVPADKKSFTVSYQVNNVSQEFNLTENSFTAIPDTNLAYYDIAVSAFDLRDSIRIIVDDEIVYSYSLANYVHSVQGESEHLTTLMDALWAYSLASETYADLFNSQSPTVNLTVDTKPLQSIVANTAEEYEAALILQSAIKKKTGITLPINTEASAGADVIVKIVAPVASYDAKVYVEDGDLVLGCGYKSFASGAATQFVNDYLVKLNSSFDFKKSFVERYYTNAIYYSDFGAIGDGVTSDFFAMKATHDMANATKRHTVYADSGKTYLIEDTRDENGTVRYITITTNVNWGDANIIIRDTNFSSFDGTGVTSQNIFVIAPDKSAIKINDKATIDKLLADGFGIGTKKIDLGLDKAVMIVPYNTSHKVYRRVGYGKYDGQDMHELILIDAEGNVDPTTPVVFDYSSIDYLLVYDIDETPITIEGGIITTEASQQDIIIRDENGNVTGAHNAFINRGIKINRSNTTIKNVKHYVTGEITLAEQEESILGAPYHGFFSTDFVNNVTLDSCILTGRRCYSKSYVPGAGSGATGSYDYTVDNSNGVTFKNCVQSNFWIKPIYKNGVVVDVVAAKEGDEGAQLSMTRIQYVAGSKINFKRYWGLGGANHSKNMSFIGSTLSRFDSHSGLFGAYIIDSDVNGISITGGGEALIQNSRWFANGDGECDSFVDLRGDYGSTWRGTITIKDSAAYLVSDYNFSVLGVSYSNWYFGYTVTFPNLVLDNVTYLDLNGNSLLDANGNPLSKHVEVKGSTGSKSGDIFDYQGRIRLLSVGYDKKNILDKEPNVHLDTTLNSAPIFAYVDENGDGYVDDIYEA